MTQPHKTLAECIEDVEFFDLMQQYRNAPIEDQEQVISCFNRVKDFILASQFVKKDEAVIDCKYCAELPGRCGMCEMATGQVSSDVRQVALDYLVQRFKDNPEYLTPLNEYVRVLSDFFQAGAKWQSTQQPATINWLTEEEIREIANADCILTASQEHRFDILKSFQSKLKERVNCVDGYSEQDVRDSYRAGAEKQTYHLKDTRCILPKNYEGVDG